MLCSLKVTFRDAQISPYNLNMTGIYIYMSDLYMKYAEHGRSARQRATLHSDQQRNHWKTPTGFQCWLPGQHQQKLPTIVAKLQKMMKRAQNNRMEGGTKLEIQ